MTRIQFSPEDKECGGRRRQYTVQHSSFVPLRYLCAARWPRFFSPSHVKRWARSVGPNAGNFRQFRSWYPSITQPSPVGACIHPAACDRMDHGSCSLRGPTMWCPAIKARQPPRHNLLWELPPPPRRRDHLSSLSLLCYRSKTYDSIRKEKE